MATKYWNGSASTDWNASANWTASGKPSSSDVVIFDGRTTRDVALNPDQTGVDLASMHIMSSYTGDIFDNNEGGAGVGPLIIEINGTLQISGTGSYYIMCGNDAANSDIVKTIIDTTGTVGLSSQKNSESANLKSVFTDVVIIRGTVYFYGLADEDDTGFAAESGTNGGCIFTNLEIAPLSGRDSSVNVTIGNECDDKASGGTYGSIVMNGGTLNLHTRLTALTQSGGTTTFGTASYDVGTTGSPEDDIITLSMYGGTLNWQPSYVAGGVRLSASKSPAITTCHLYSGTLNATGMLETYETSGTAPTIVTLHQYSGSVIDMRNTYGNILVTTFNKHGGIAYTDPQQTLAVT